MLRKRTKLRSDIVGYIQKVSRSAMDIVGYIEAGRREYRLGEPISVTLFIKNRGDKPAYLFVPRGRADGIRVRVKEGEGLRLKDMTEEPEPGLVQETKVAPGGTYSQEYPLGRWLVLDKPGSYTVECEVEVEGSDASLRDTGGKRMSLRTTIRSDVHFVVLGKAGGN